MLFRSDWQRFPLPQHVRRGKYLITAEYFAFEEKPAPVVQLDLQQDGRIQKGQVVTLRRTSGFSCAITRTQDLGTFELSGRSGSLTLTAMEKSELSLYGLTLIRLPDEEPTASSNFRLENFDVAANRQRFTVHAQTPGAVLINDTFYPGWTATVDGQPVDILRADSLFRAIPVSAGSHRIEMKFFPRHFWWGAGISLLTVLGLAIFLRRTRHQDHPE